MGRLFHRIVHFFSMNSGRVVSHTDEHGNIWLGFQCDKCGQVSGAHISKSSPGSQESED